MTDYRLYYWPLPFRGNFIQLMLEYVGASYAVAPIEELQAFKQMPARDQGIPAMAPPVLECARSGYWINQMPAIMSWLADQHSLDAKDWGDQAIALKIVLDCNDVLGDITRANGAQMWDQAAWRDFRSVRLPRWLEVFEEIARRHGVQADRGYLFQAENPGIGDFALTALLGSIGWSLDTLLPDLEQAAPRVMSLVGRMESEEKIAAFLGQQRVNFGQGYCGGQIERSIREMLERDTA